VPFQWAVLQLREPGEALPVADLERDLLARSPQTVMRFPAIRAGLLDRDNPLSAYVFVKHPTASLSLEASQYAARYLRVPGTSRLQVVTEAELKQMAVPPALPPTGTLVRVIAGDWSDMEGIVVAQNCTKVAVLLELWSKRAVIELPPSELRVV
jgi:hypothetical protein